MQPLECRGVKCGLDRLLAYGGDVGETHAAGGQYASKRMDKNSGHAQRISDPAGMLPAGAAETDEGVGRDVMPALHGYFLDGVRHVLDGDAQGAFCNGLYVI